MGFEQALSGLNASSAALDAISNNVANSGTVGFKEGQTHFADIFASALNGAGTGQVGIGTSMSSVAQNFTAGNITVTNNPLDLAINGSGFFQLSNGNYTRNGQFHVDATGNIVNDQSQMLQGYKLSPTTGQQVGSATSLQISSTQVNGGQAKATATSAIAVNLDSRLAQPSTFVAPSVATPQGWIVPSQFPLTLNAYTFSITAGTTAPSNSMTTTPPISLTGTYNSLSDLQTAMQSAITASFAGNTQSIPTPKVSLNATGDGIKITGGASGAAANLSIVDDPSGTIFGLADIVAGSNGTFDPTNTNTYNSSTSETVYDSQGTSHVLTSYFSKSAIPGQWSVNYALDNATVRDPASALTPQAAFTTTANFDANGNIDPTTAAVTLPSITLGQNMTPTAGPSAALPLNIKLDLTGSTQFGATFAVTQMTQDGYAPGTLSGVSVSTDGKIQARYSNGQSINLFQVQLVNFNNPNGLQSLGGNQWAATAASGAPSTIGVPGGPGLGTLQSGSVEESNVDLTKELVDMITQQRAYQANAQSIKTEDQIMQTITSLR